MTTESSIPGTETHRESFVPYGPLDVQAWRTTASSYLVDGTRIIIGSDAGLSRPVLKLAVRAFVNQAESRYDYDSYMVNVRMVDGHTVPFLMTFVYDLYISDAAGRDFIPRGKSIIFRMDGTSIHRITSIGYDPGSPEADKRAGIIMARGERW